MKEKIAKILGQHVNLSKAEIINLIEIPPNREMGDFAFPCFSLAKTLKKNPFEIAKEISSKLKLSDEFEKAEAKGPYVNFFTNPNFLAEQTLKTILKEKNLYGKSKVGKGKTIAIDMSSPNIAKPFGIGHLRSTIIGNSIANISQSNGFKVVKINYLGDWGTQFGKLIVGYKRKGSEAKLKKEPIKHLLELYIEGNKEEYEEEAREWFKKLENGNKEALAFWKKFKDYSIKDFEKIYKLLNVKFDVISGESCYNNKMDAVVGELKKKGLLEESENAQVVNLEKHNPGLGVALIKKSDGTTLYVTRDLAAAIDRKKKYKFSRMFYEVGSEQNLHFKQLFKILELLGYSWAKSCVHIQHGLYLDKDGKKFATRKGKTIFMEDIFEETKALAKKEIMKREKLSTKELEKRAQAIALSAIIFGDLKNYRENNITFDIDRFVSFEGDTGPYILYSYARARSILRKAKYKSSKQKLKISAIDEKEKALLSQLSQFPEVIKHAYTNLAPNLIANYAYQLAQTFNEFYHSGKVIGSENQQFKLVLVDCFSQVLKNSLSLLGISTIEKM